MNLLYTIGGYATLFGVGYALYLVSTQKAKKRSATIQPKVARSSFSEPRKDDRKKKQRMEKFASEAQESSSKTSEQTEAPSPEPTWLSNTSPKSRSDEVDNREFAKQLSKAKAGTTFAAKSDSGKQREKSVKQSRANQISGFAEEKKAPLPVTSADEANTSADEAEAAAAPADASGVADMLEPAPAAPSILRITDTTSKTQKPKAAKAPEPVETKKQRQNRKKAEAAKAARQEAEQERKLLEEKQRRQARIAEGRAAKDGSQFMAVNGNKSAWTQGAANGASDKASDAEVLHQPLDTFEQPKPEPVRAEPAATGTWASSLPSEEEQMEMLKDEADEWSTVKTKSSKKPAKKSSPAESGDERTSQARPAAPAPALAPASKQTNGTASAKPAPPKNFGSFSALTTKDEPAEESEEEWDV
ncbi:hypothetical protein B0I35DRAFT_345967 [Stachybotrys elegans]|uniref:Uncharacterized protein n=1 Tax=Stachybotrys elegans TaxID=80388 RepID=A0A8K0T2G4_9HYPO|nr:hypothetical protein B0I35DRAFT_345967 [Stachybotrys elegans]